MAECFTVTVTVFLREAKSRGRMPTGKQQTIEISTTANDMIVSNYYYYHYLQDLCEAERD